MELITGNVYKRSELHDTFGGSRQSGISPCSAHPYVFIFSTARGEDNGYDDGWSEDNQYFYYSGEGQIGDMEFKRGNRSLLHHVEENRQVLLFQETEKTFVELKAQLELVDYEELVAPDREGNNRRVIRFLFERLADSPSDQPISTRRHKSERKYIKPNTTSRKGLVTSRVGQGWYRQAIRQKFNDKCAVTGASNSQILIASHIVPWRDATDYERLDENNGILLSPNYDALFDRHLISFEDNGTLIISNKVSETELVALGINYAQKCKVHEGMLPYLKRHRDALQNKHG
jgi:5-methylcytosine-specific restriction enzyme A